MLTQKVGCSAEVAGGRSADHFDVMAFPVHLPAADGIRGHSGEGAEIGDCKSERRIGRDRVTERRYRIGRVRGLLRLAIEGGGLDVCRDHPTVIIDRGTSNRGRPDTAGVRPF